MIAAGMRFYQIGRPSLWWDEVLSIEIAVGRGTVHDSFPDGVIRYDQPNLLGLSNAAPWPQIWNHVQISSHPPLYYIVLRWWMDVLGNGPAAIRSLSAIFSLAGIILFFDLCRLLHGTKTALLAAAIMALAIGQIDIGQDARNYPMLILLALVCANLIIRIERNGPTLRRILGLCFSGSALLLTHYFAIPLYAVLFAYVIIRLRGRERRQTAGILVAAGLFVAVAWGRGLYWQLRMSPSLNPSYLQETLPHHAMQTIFRVLKLPIIFLFGESWSDRTPLAGHIAASILALIVPIVMLRRRKDLLLWVLWMWSTIGFVTLLDLMHGSILLEYSRYTILASPAVYAFLAAFNWPPYPKWRNAIPIVLIGALAVADGLRLRQPVPAKEDFKLLSEIIDSKAAPGELLVFYNDSQWVSPGVWYVCYKYYSPDSHRPWMTLHHPANRQTLVTLRDQKVLWLIGRQPEIDGPLILPGWQPDEVWPTSAGRFCLMRRVENAR